MSAAEIGAVLELIASEQVRPDRSVPTLSVDVDVLRSELDEFEPSWTSVARLTRSAADDTVVGAILVEWSVDAGRAWIHGPWVGVDDDRWLDHAVPLVSATLGQFPVRVTRAVMCGSVDHRLLGALATTLGWDASEVSHALCLTEDRMAAWPTTEDRGVALRDAAAHDADAIRPLHDREFPSTYYTAAELVERADDDAQTVLVATDDGGAVCGYAAGRVQPDGDGYVDFVAVATRQRRRGIGRVLTVELARRLVRESPTRRICLTVRDSNHEARALYESLGFEIDVSIAPFESIDATSMSESQGSDP